MKKTNSHAQKKDKSETRVRWPKSGQERNKFLQLLQELRAELILSLYDDGGCDHSVGICCCGTIRRLESLDEFLMKFGITKNTEDEDRKLLGYKI